MGIFAGWLSKLKAKLGLDSKIIVAEVLAWAKHQNADRLRVVKLNIGPPKARLAPKGGGDRVVAPVVCGATNFDVGDKVVLALPGAQISRSHKENKPFVLAKAVLRGIESQGMICSAYELGMSDSAAEGILVLDRSIRPGTPFSDNMSGSDCK